MHDWSSTRNFVIPVCLSSWNDSICVTMVLDCLASIHGFFMDMAGGPMVTEAIEVAHLIAGENVNCRRWSVNT